jgi:RecG-like helicase
VVAPPLDPLELLDTPIGRSGLPGANVVARAGKRLGIVRVRDLLFRVPRRYEDLREMRRIGDLGAVADGELVSARVRVAELRVEPSFRRRVSGRSPASRTTRAASMPPGSGGVTSSDA